MSDRPLWKSFPPPVLKEATHIAALDALAWGRWPHLFTVLAREYKVPTEFFITLIFLWDATVGSKSSPSGKLALSQIPGRERTVGKWLAALEAAEFFTVEKAGPHDHEGSTYTYNEETTAESWEAFFEKAEWLDPFPSWDKADRKKFAALFAPDRLLNEHQSGWLQMFKRTSPRKKTGAKGEGR